MPTLTAATASVIGFAGMISLFFKPTDSINQGDIRAGYGCSARPAIGLNHVTIDQNGPLPQKRQICDGT